MLVGIGFAVYIYIYNFNKFSETELIFWVPFWLFPIILGYYGIVASNVLEQKRKNGFETVSKTVFEIVKERMGVWFIPLILLLHLPFLIVKSKSILLTGFVGAIVWGIAMHVFLKYIFPYL